jgi:hypothetical protein
MQRVLHLACGEFKVRRLSYRVKNQFISMVCAPQNFACGRPSAYAPTLAVILNLFQDLLAIVISRDLWDAGRSEQQACNHFHGLCLTDHFVR